MKISIFMLSVVSLFLSNLSFAHGPGGRVGIELDQTAIQAGNNTLSFQLVDDQEKKLLSDADLAISNEKILHFIVYDKSLQEFQHVHPSYVKDHWEVSLLISRNGDYFVWAQGQIAADSFEFSASGDVSVTGGLAANPIPSTFGSQLVAQDSGSIVTFPSQVIKANQMTMLNITFSRTDGTPVVLTPYLGSMAHVISTSSDGDSLIHVHPMATSQSNVLMLHAMFPEVGFYRVWVQFIDGGVLKLAPLMVEVVE